MGMLMMHRRSRWHGPHGSGVIRSVASLWSLAHHHLLLVHELVNARGDHTHEVKCLWLGGRLGDGHLGMGLG